MIFFDLDGTLYRTHETCLPPLYALCDTYGLSLSKNDEAFLLHTTADALLNKIAPSMPHEKKEQFKHDLKWTEIEEVKKRGRLFDGVKELLCNLREAGFSLAICGMGSKEYINCVLDRCNIKSYFDAILHRIDGMTKSEVLAEYINQRQLSRQDCIMIGDSITDITAAKDNGIPFIGVSYGYGLADIQGKAVIVDSVSQISGEIHRTLIYSRIEQN